MEDQITNLLAQKAQSVLEAMKDDEIAIFENVNIGRQNKIGQYSKPTSEIMIDDEDEFLYTFEKHHRSRSTVLMISIFVKGLTQVAEKKKLNIKDLVITELEENPTFDDLGISSQIIGVANGVRVEGMGKNAKLYSASQIRVKVKLSNPAGTPIGP
ncbi:hypothetical protein [uncultured Methanobacterium sp.]|uniref:hypothetical protein n=1 Tax=uncultured Methanobacterium sp. TaxID=176306 RepID=UPI002AA8C352|nr:hypothetical protein [uncultured Methanobacterium sp.]